MKSNITKKYIVFLLLLIIFFTSVFYGLMMYESKVMNIHRESKFIVLYLVLFVLLFIGALLVFKLFLKDFNHQVDDIINMVDNINNKNYSIDISDISSDNMSKLKCDIQKTAILLKEQLDNNLSDKLNLKRSLSDISHQIKTPITSVMIMLDNMIDNPNMDDKTREEFIFKIKKEITNINFLTNSILKLSRFDSSTVDYNKDTFLVKDILKEAFHNVELLCDLKNVEVMIDCDEQAFLVCDFKWQVEAITNILKNSVESSSEHSKVEVFVCDKKAYLEIRIRDYGDGIDTEDLPHIFDRFFRGKNANHDSIGIGLSLSQTIIEKNNGALSVANKDVGVEFKIVYYK